MAPKIPTTEECIVNASRGTEIQLSFVFPYYSKMLVASVCIPHTLQFFSKIYPICVATTLHLVIIL